MDLTTVFLDKKMLGKNTFIFVIIGGCCVVVQINILTQYHNYIFEFPYLDAGIIIIQQNSERINVQYKITI